jgi:hypothetical protein
VDGGEGPKAPVRAGIPGISRKFAQSDALHGVGKWSFNRAAPRPHLDQTAKLFRISLPG